MLLVAAIYAWTTHRLSLPLVIMAVAIGAMEAWLRAPQALLPREGLAVGDDRSAFPRCHWGDGGMAPASVSISDEKLLHMPAIGAMEAWHPQGVPLL